MISKSLTKKLAGQILSAMNMKKGESLYIKGGTHEQELIEEMGLQAAESGIDILCTARTDGFFSSSYERIPIRYLKQTSRIGMKLADVVDNYIGLERPKDPRIMERISHSKIAASVEGAEPISKRMDKKHVKWCFVGFPTKEMATKLGIKYSLLKKFIFGGILINRKKMVKDAEFLRKKLSGADTVHLTDEYGTDLTIRICNRRINADDAYISDADIKRKEVGANLPGGEVFIAPHEFFGSGVLVSPKRTDRFTGKMIENIRLVFEKGTLNLKKTTAEKNEKTMKNTIKKSMAIDKKIYKVVRTTNIAELGIGLNPAINKIIGYLLTDEKIGGTIHVAIGKNKMYGGRSLSSLHWDFVSHKGITLEVFYPNKKSALLIEKGKILF